MAILFSQQEFVQLKSLLVLYRCALKNMVGRVDTLQEEFNNLQATNLQFNNPIEHVKTRLKTPESIAKKLHRRELEVTAKNARECLTDIAGLRCICSYAKEIKHIAEVFKRQPDLKILREKNYVDNPKASGYRSHHLIIEVPIHLTDRTERIPVEVQIRTQAMDFWATLEHKVKYKYNNQMPEHISLDLIECAEKISELDRRMYVIQDIVNLAY